MALSRPCVAFDAGGAARQLADTGRVVPSGDLDGFADAILGLLDDPSLRQTLGDQARQRVDHHFDRTAFAQAVHRLVGDA
jgi:glycosyltransferase involved in cell wall biosynthesis